MTDHAPPGGRAADEHRETAPTVEHTPLDVDTPSPFELSSPFEPADSDEPDESQEGSAAPRGPGRGRLAALGTLAALGLVGAAVLGTAGYRIISQKDASLSTPEVIGALRRQDGEEARTTAEYLRDALSAEVDLDDTVGAVYTDGAGSTRSVLFFGGTTLVWTPESDLDTAFELISDDTGAVNDVRDVPAGELGGTMKCGTTASPDGDIAVCGWADHGSLALAMFPDRAPAEAGTVLLDIRNAVQTRS